MGSNGRVAELATTAERVAAIPYWYHRIELPDGIVTPGWAPIHPAAYRLPADLTGRRVLDVGAWDGYWTFEALKRGADYVLAIDNFTDPPELNANVGRPHWETFDVCRDALGFGPDRCERREMSLYDLSPESVGTFDLVLFFGVIYHQRHPLLALERVASVCEGEILVESAILDDYSPYQGGFGQGYPGRQMVMQFYPGREYGGVATNWWVPTLYLLMHLMAAAGFREIKSWRLTREAPDQLPLCRGFAGGKK